MDDHAEDNSLHEKPLEFLTGIANSGGHCDGRAILSENGQHGCFCSCGEWDVEALSQDDGLHLARVHTGSVPA